MCSLNIVVDMAAYSCEKGLLHASLTRFIITFTKATVKEEGGGGEADSIPTPIHHSQRYLHPALESIKPGETGADFLLNSTISHRPIFQD